MKVLESFIENFEKLKKLELYLTTSERSDGSFLSIVGQGGSLYVQGVTAPKLPSEFKYLKTCFKDVTCAPKQPDNRIGSNLSPIIRHIESWELVTGNTNPLFGRGLYSSKEATDGLIDGIKELIIATDKPVMINLEKLIRMIADF